MISFLTRYIFQRCASLKDEYGFCSLGTWKAFKNTADIWLKCVTPYFPPFYIIQQFPRSCVQTPPPLLPWKWLGYPKLKKYIFLHSSSTFFQENFISLDTSKANSLPLPKTPPCPLPRLGQNPSFFLRPHLRTPRTSIQNYG